jgi:hypothetical protein
MMMTAGECRPKAAEVRERAKEMSGLDGKREYLFLADQWTALARTAEKQDDPESRTSRPC